jgi:hypothetical protein
VAILAGLANVMSLPPLALPIQIGGFASALHFFQLAIFLCGIIYGGPYFSYTIAFMSVVLRNL